MKILYVTTIGATMCFFDKFIQELIEEGHTVDIATNNTVDKVPNVYLELGCKIYQVDCCRSPLHKNNLIAVKQIKKIVENNHYDIVHCHTPVAAMCTRAACLNVRKKGTKVIYTAHGLHFYKGAPLINWLIFFPIEWLCSWWTDAIVLINKEDYQVTKRYFGVRKCVRIPGVGIDLKRFDLSGFDRSAYREKMGIREDDILILSVGEVNKNKNHQLVIRAIAQINDPRIKYYIAGVGEMIEENEKLADELGIGNSVYFLGFRSDIAELDTCSDVFAFPSIREGLGLASIEALACGTPVVGMNTRGINEYVINGQTGYKFDNTTDSCVNAIKQCLDMINKDGNYAERCKKIAQGYSHVITSEIVKGLYNEC